MSMNCGCDGASSMKFRAANLRNHVEGVADYPLVHIEVPNIMLAPMHVYTGVMSELLKVLFAALCPDSKKAMETWMKKIGLQWDRNPEELSGKHGLILIRRYTGILENVTDGM